MVVYMLLRRVRVTLSMTVRLSLILFRLCEWLLLNWMKWLNIGFSRLRGTLDLLLLISIIICVFRMRILSRMCAAVHWTVPLMRPCIVCETRRGLVSICVGLILRLIARADRLWS